MRYVLSALLVLSFLVSKTFALPLRDIVPQESAKLVVLCPEGVDLLHAWLAASDGVKPHHYDELRRAAAQWGADRGVMTVPFHIEETETGLGITLICIPFFF